MPEDQLSRRLSHREGPGGRGPCRPGGRDGWPRRWTKFAAAIVGNPMLRDHVINRTPLARHAQPTEIAGAAVYLLLNASSFTTGSVMVVDGGLTAV